MPRKNTQQIKQQMESEIAPFLRTLGQADSLITKTEAVDILQKGASPLLIQLKQNASVLSETLANSIRVFAGKKGYKVYLGPDYRRSVLAGVGGGQLGHLFEYGTVERTRRSISEGGKVKIVSTGIMPARPWMRPAWDAKKDEAFSISEKLVINLMEKKLKRTIKK